MCGRRIYAEGRGFISHSSAHRYMNKYTNSLTGTVDAVLFLDGVRKSVPEKRLYDMIDVLESGKMT